MVRIAKRFADRIASDPKIMVGKPVIKGTRVPVERVLQHLAFTPDFEDLFQAIPHITMEDVQACLAFASNCVSAKRHRAKANSTDG